MAKNKSNKKKSQSSTKTKSLKARSTELALIPDNKTLAVIVDSPYLNKIKDILNQSQFKPQTYIQGTGLNMLQQHVISETAKYIESNSTESNVLLFKKYQDEQTQLIPPKNEKNTRKNALNGIGDENSKVKTSSSKNESWETILEKECQCFNTVEAMSNHLIQLSKILNINERLVLISLYIQKFKKNEKVEMVDFLLSLSLKMVAEDRDINIVDNIKIHLFYIARQISPTLSVHLEATIGLLSILHQPSYKDKLQDPLFQNAIYLFGLYECFEKEVDTEACIFKIAQALVPVFWEIMGTCKTLLKINIDTDNLVGKLKTIKNLDDLVEILSRLAEFKGEHVERLIVEYIDEAVKEENYASMRVRFDRLLPFYERGVDLLVKRRNTSFLELKKIIRDRFLPNIAININAIDFAKLLSERNLKLPKSYALTKEESDAFLSKLNDWYTSYMKAHYFASSLESLRLTIENDQHSIFEKETSNIEKIKELFDTKNIRDKVGIEAILNGQTILSDSERDIVGPMGALLEIYGADCFLNEDVSVIFKKRQQKISSMLKKYDQLINDASNNLLFEASGQIFEHLKSISKQIKIQSKPIQNQNVSSSFGSNDIYNPEQMQSKKRNKTSHLTAPNTKNSILPKKEACQSTCLPREKTEKQKTDLVSFLFAQHGQLLSMQRHIEQQIRVFNIKKYSHSNWTENELAEINFKNDQLLKSITKQNKIAVMVMHALNKIEIHYIHYMKIPCHFIDSEGKITFFVGEKINLLKEIKKNILEIRNLKKSHSSQPFWPGVNEYFNFLDYWVDEESDGIEVSKETLFTKCEKIRQELEELKKSRYEYIENNREFFFNNPKPRYIYATKQVNLSLKLSEIELILFIRDESTDKNKKEFVKRDAEKNNSESILSRPEVPIENNSPALCSQDKPISCSPGFQTSISNEDLEDKLGHFIYFSLLKGFTLLISQEGNKIFFQIFEAHFKGMAYASELELRSKLPSYLKASLQIGDYYFHVGYKSVEERGALSLFEVDLQTVYLSEHFQKQIDSLVEKIRKEMSAEAFKIVDKYQNKINEILESSSPSLTSASAVQAPVEPFKPSTISSLDQAPAQPAKTPVPTVVKAPAQPAKTPVPTVVKAPAQPAKTPVPTVVKAPAQPAKAPVPTVVKAPAQPAKTAAPTVAEAPAQPAKATVPAVAKAPAQPAKATVPAVAKAPAQPAKATVAPLAQPKVDWGDFPWQEEEEQEEEKNKVQSSKRDQVSEKNAVKTPVRKKGPQRLPFNSSTNTNKSQQGSGKANSRINRALRTEQSEPSLVNEEQIQKDQSQSMPQSPKQVINRRKPSDLSKSQKSLWEPETKVRNSSDKTNSALFQSNEKKEPMTKAVSTIPKAIVEKSSYSQHEVGGLQKNVNIGAKELYSDEHINYLIQGLIRNESRVFNIDAYHLPNEREHFLEAINTLLADDKFKCANFPKKIFIPINPTGGHWVLVFVNYAEENALPIVAYFDPLGNHCPKTIKALFQTCHLIESVDNVIELENPRNCVQRDSINCGPWVIEGVRSLLVEGAIPDARLNIIEARQVHNHIYQEMMEGKNTALVSKPIASQGAQEPVKPKETSTGRNKNKISVSNQASFFTQPQPKAKNSQLNTGPKNLEDGFILVKQKR